MDNVAISSGVPKYRKISYEGYIHREVTFDCHLRFVFPNWENSREMELRGTLRGKNREEDTMPERMWDIVKRRIVVDRTGESGRVGKRLPSRLLCILDISPVIALILLASTPKLVILQVC